MNKINYDNLLKETVKELNGERKRVLLHSCCAPCSTAVLERLTPYFDVTVFYYNPNITESEEYYVRLNEQKKFLKTVYGEAVPLIEGKYSSREFFVMTEGYEKCPEGGERCSLCFEDRLRQTAKVAKENGFDYFCTTLTVSPHKNSQVINTIGEKMAKEYGCSWLYADFKKGNGYKRSVELAKEYDLYRQNYCGCLFSKYTHIVTED
ncbi:MAG: epoxyqueuosine reductase QueH [Clostridiales bacterium]|nr:epoxyqueuosine reductase QueH [Clostridiales bacterium]